MEGNPGRIMFTNIQLQRHSCLFPKRETTVVFFSPFLHGLRRAFLLRCSWLGVPGPRTTAPRFRPLPRGDIKSCSLGAMRAYCTTRTSRYIHIYIYPDRAALRPIGTKATVWHGMLPG